MRKAKTTEQFIADARAIHGDRYDYSKTQYLTNREKVLIICPTHGEFWQRASHHLEGRGCPKCRRHTESKKLPRKLIYGVGIYDVPYPTLECKECYETWVGMIARCYSPCKLRRKPTYKRCSVCEEWKYFSKFKEWFDEQGYRKGYNLDKDILVQGNLVYSSSTCCFVPQYINLLILNRVRIKGKYKVGVCKIRDKFVAQCRMRDKNINLGSYLTEEEAHMAYKKGKEAYIKEVAEEAYSKGEITKEVRDALYKWEIKEY